MKNFLKISIAISTSIIVLFIIYVVSQQEVKDADLNLYQRPVLNTEEHYLGSSTATIIMVKYSEPECPNCKKLHPILKQIVDESKGKVAFVYRHFPLPSHQKSFVEAVALECVTELRGEVGFWQYLEALYEKTPSNNEIDLAILPEIAVDMGIVREEFEYCIESDAHKARINRDINTGLAIGVDSVPQLFIFSDTSEVLAFRNRASYSTLNQTISSLLGSN